MHLLFFIIFAVLAVFSFFFSLAETSIISLSKIKLRHMLVNDIAGAKSLARITAKSDKLIVAILFGNNFVNVSLSVLCSVVLIHAIGEKWGVLLATIITTLFILVFLEIMPKVLAIKHTEKIALITGPIMETIMKIFNPAVQFFSNISNLILKISRISSAKRSPLVTQEELRMMIEVGEEEGAISNEERKMLHRIFEFGETEVKDVMVLGEKIVAVNENASAEEIMAVFVEQGHSRLPVYHNCADTITGVIYARDLFYVIQNKNVFVVRDLIYPIYKVLAETKVSDLLRQFQKNKIQIAVVADKNNKTLGLVTLEDLVEEIVGEIEENPAAMRR